MRAGRLRERFDVIILPDQSSEQIIEEHEPGTIPPQYLGGITMEGVSSLEKFVRAGGILICNNNSSTLAMDHFKLPVSNILKGVGPNEFYVAGSILKLDYDTSHPVAFGMSERGVAYFNRAQAFRIHGGDEDSETAPKVVARYPNEPLLLSGREQGAKPSRTAFGCGFAAERPGRSPRLQRGQPMADAVRSETALQCHFLQRVFSYQDVLFTC